MKSETQKEFIVDSNNILHFNFNNFDEMQEYGKNWSFYCKYRFGTGNFAGKYDIYQNDNFQLAIASYEDGLMYNGHPPYETITVALVIQNEGTLCINRHKMYKEDILILDDINEYSIVFSKKLKLGIISIKKEFVKTNMPFLFDMQNNVYKDKKGQLYNLLERLQTLATEKTITSQFINSLKGSLLNQKIISKKLTKGEEVAFEAREFMLNELQSCININLISTNYNISEKTLQNSFRSLFGFTPKQFSCLLKLNLAHRDLSQNNSQVTVAQVATKWGFSHLGRFSKEYKKVFEVSPSITLKNSNVRNSHIEDKCII